MLLIASPKPTHSADLRSCELPSSIWHVPNTIPDWDDQPFKWDNELEAAANSIQEEYVNERCAGTSCT